MPHMSLRASAYVTNQLSALPARPCPLALLCALDLPDKFTRSANDLRGADVEFSCGEVAVSTESNQRRYQRNVIYLLKGLTSTDDVSLTMPVI